MLSSGREEWQLSSLSINVLPIRGSRKALHIEKELLQSREEYQQLVETMNEGFVVVDKLGKIAYANKRFSDMLGYSLEEIIGTTTQDYFVEKNRTSFERRMEMRSHEAASTYVTELVGKQGRKIWVKISTSLRFDLKKTPAGSFAVITDITEQVQVEEALRESEQAKRMLAAQVMSAQEKERKRIAYELHDGIGQTLSAIKFYVENAISKCNMHTCPANENITLFKSIVPKLQDAIVEVRRISMDLRPSILDDIGILATLAWFSREFQVIYDHIRVELKHNIQESDIPKHLKVVIFRIVQEAMNNCAKYGKADNLQICVAIDGNTLELVVKDNGQGFDYAEVLARDKSVSGGMGLISLRERAEVSNGKFSIESAKGKGTCITVVW
jgi:PAS domain S-box-containing protein